MEKKVFWLEEISTPSCSAYPFTPQGFRTARQSRFIARREINTQGKFLPWEWQVSDRLILVGYATFIGDFPEGSRPLRALLLRKTILFFGQVVQKGELAGLKAWLHVTESGEGASATFTAKFHFFSVFLFLVGFLQYRSSLIFNPHVRHAMNIGTPFLLRGSVHLI